MVADSEISLVLGSKSNRGSFTAFRMTAVRGPCIVVNWQLRTCLRLFVSNDWVNFRLAEFHRTVNRGRRGANSLSGGGIISVAASGIALEPAHPGQLRGKGDYSCGRGLMTPVPLVLAQAD